MYVGDAAGRDGDHSICDIGFAKNVVLPFKTPEQFFLDSTATFKPNFPFDPIKFLENYEPNEDKINYPDGKEMIVFIGYPGCNILIS